MSETTCKDVAACLWQDGACAANPASQTFISKLLDPALDNAFACAQHAAEDVCTPLGCVWKDGACQAGFDQHNMGAAQVLGWMGSGSLADGGRAYAQEVQKLSQKCAPHATATACTDASEYCAWSSSQKKCAVASDKWATVLGLPRVPADSAEKAGLFLAGVGSTVFDFLEHASVPPYETNTLSVDCTDVQAPPPAGSTPSPQLAALFDDKTSSMSVPGTGWTVTLDGNNVPECKAALLSMMSDIEKMAPHRHHATNPCYGKTYYACTNMDTAGCAQFDSGAQAAQCLNHMNGCMGMTSKPACVSHGTAGLCQWYAGSCQPSDPVCTWQTNQCLPTHPECTWDSSTSQCGVAPKRQGETCGAAGAAPDPRAPACAPGLVCTPSSNVPGAPMTCQTPTSTTTTTTLSPTPRTRTTTQALKK